MNRLFAYALLGLGVTHAIVGCDDDDDSNPGNVSGSAGTATGGSATGGQNAGGSAQAAGNAGKSAGGSGGGAGGTTTTGGTAGAGGNSQVSGGETSMGGAGGETSMGGAGGETSMGGAGGDTSAGGDGTGGEASAEPQTADPYWLSRFCDASSQMTLMCEDSPTWTDCFTKYYPYLTEGPLNGECTEPVGQEEELPNLLAMIAALDALETACPKPTTADWRCTLEGASQPKDQGCAEAYAATKAAYSVCSQ